MNVSGGVCDKYVNCSTCSNYKPNIFKYDTFQRGTYIPKEKCVQNMIYFILEGEVWVNSMEHPDTILRKGQFILQPVGSSIEYRVHTPTECIKYYFDRIQYVCIERNGKDLLLQSRNAACPVVMECSSSMEAYLQGMKLYLKDDLMCSDFLQAKRSELFYLLTCYYPIKEMVDFYASVYSFSRKFEYFVISNYLKVRDVEDLAELGGYSVSTFRRMFRETFEEPPHQWIVKKKCEDIYKDLKSSDLPIKKISTKYGFDSLANFSHFCRNNLGKSPRAVRME